MQSSMIGRINQRVTFFFLMCLFFGNMKKNPNITEMSTQVDYKPPSIEHKTI